VKNKLYHNKTDSWVINKMYWKRWWHFCKSIYNLYFGGGS